MYSGKSEARSDLERNTRTGKVPEAAVDAYVRGKRQRRAEQAAASIMASTTGLPAGAEQKPSDGDVEERLKRLEDALGNISLGTKTKPIDRSTSATNVFSINGPKPDTVDIGSYLRGAATKRWDGAERAREVFDALTTGGDGSGIVPDLVNNDVWYELVGRLAITESGSRVMVLPNGSYDVPKEATAPSASWLAEQDTMSDAGGEVDKVGISPHKVGALVEVSNELLMDAPMLADEVIRTSLVNALTRALNIGFLVGTGADNQPTGIFEASGLAGGDQSEAALTPDLLIEAFHNVAGVGGNPANIRAILHPNAAIKLDSYRENDGETSEGGYLVSSTPASIANMARVVTDNAPFTSGTPDTADVMVGDFAQGAMVYQFGNMRVDVDPYGAFDKDSVRFRATLRVDIAVRQPSLLYSLANVDVS
ncbi:MAG: phage major capsid protein [Spirochaetota bacterium]